MWLSDLDFPSANTKQLTMTNETERLQFFVFTGIFSFIPLLKKTYFFENSSQMVSCDWGKGNAFVFLLLLRSQERIIRCVLVYHSEWINDAISFLQIVWNFKFFQAWHLDKLKTQKFVHPSVEFDQWPPVCKASCQSMSKHPPTAMWCVL